MYHNTRAVNAKASSVDLTTLILEQRSHRSLSGRCTVKEREREREREGGGGRENRGALTVERVAQNLSIGLYNVFFLSLHRARQLYHMDIAGTSVTAAVLGTAIKETHCTYKFSWICAIWRRGVRKKLPCIY
jgi:hypothetical protein